MCDVFENRHYILLTIFWNHVFRESGIMYSVSLECFGQLFLDSFQLVVITREQRLPQAVLSGLDPEMLRSAIYSYHINFSRTDAKYFEWK